MARTPRSHGERWRGCLMLLLSGALSAHAARLLELDIPAARGQSTQCDLNAVAETLAELGSAISDAAAPQSEWSAEAVHTVRRFQWAFASLTVFGIRLFLDATGHPALGVTPEPAISRCQHAEVASAALEELDGRPSPWFQVASVLPLHSLSSCMQRLAATWREDVAESVRDFCRRRSEVGLVELVVRMSDLLPGMLPGLLASQQDFDALRLALLKRGHRPHGRLAPLAAELALPAPERVAGRRGRKRRAEPPPGPAPERAPEPEAPRFPSYDPMAFWPPLVSLVSLVSPVSDDEDDLALPQGGLLEAYVPTDLSWHDMWGQAVDAANSFE